MGYTISDVAEPRSIDTFNTAESGCGAFTYTLNNQDGTAVDATIFNFISTGTQLVVTVYSTDTTKAGTYVLKLKGSLGSPYNA